MTLPGILASGGLMPGAPTIGTATDGGNGTSVNVAFTAPSWVGKGTGTVTYTATSSPGGLTGTATSSPVTVSGLTTGTAYTFTVTATTSYGVSGPSSASSNSVTPVVPTNYDFIASTYCNGTTSASIGSIPQTYKSLQLRIFNVNYGAELRVRLNGSNTLHYEMGATLGPGTTTGVSFYSNNDIFTTVWNNGAPFIVMDIPRYLGTQNSSFTSASSGAPYASGSNQRLSPFTGFFNSTNAVTSISVVVTSNIYYARIALYGLS